MQKKEDKRQISLTFYMPRLPDRAIKEFKEIWRRKYGEDLSWDEADKKANRLSRLVELLCRPEPIGKNDNDSASRLESMQFTVITGED